MSPYEYEVLRDICTAGERIRPDISTQEREQAFYILRERGWITVYFDGTAFPTSAGIIALSDYETELDRNAREKADNDRRVSAQRAQMILDKKKSLRDKLIVSAFSVALTLFLEHFKDIIDFLYSRLEMIFAHLRH